MVIEKVFTVEVPRCDDEECEQVVKPGMFSFGIYLCSDKYVLGSNAVISTSVCETKTCTVNKMCPHCVHFCTF